MSTSTFCSFAAAENILANKGGYYKLTYGVKNLYLRKLVAAAIDAGMPDIVCLMTTALDEGQDVCRVENHEAFANAAELSVSFGVALKNYCACFVGDDVIKTLQDRL
jgi:hypothetical protein